MKLVLPPLSKVYRNIYWSSFVLKNVTRVTSSLMCLSVIICAINCLSVCLSVGLSSLARISVSVRCCRDNLPLCPLSRYTIVLLHVIFRDKMSFLFRNYNFSFLYIKILMANVTGNTETFLQRKLAKHPSYSTCQALRIHLNRTGVFRFFSIYFPLPPSFLPSLPPRPQFLIFSERGDIKYF